MSDSVDKTFEAIEDAAFKRTETAFKQAVQQVGELAGQLCPVGIYRNKRGQNGKVGGDLRSSLFAEYTGLNGGKFTARFGSPLAYAEAQHEQAFYHPGMYTGRPGEKYAAKYFSRAVAMIFGDGEDPAERYTGTKPATFKELLES